MCAVKTGEVFVVSSPSGAGKSAILHRVREADPTLLFSVSATTRLPRAGECDGRDYYFVPQEEFRRRVDAGEFLEWAEVHGNLYGTLRAEMERLAASGQDAVVEIDVQGAASLRALGFRMVSVFIMPPSLAELERRLRARGTEAEDVLALRVKNARGEIDQYRQYDFVIVNDDLDTAVADFQAIVRAQRCRAERFEDRP
ncbi:MAG TPA: guanylate kinase [Candidatus Hydrogenedentes bacterium]|nr:guanylate kinase [Candidatus Hydrogenedentota bacterium]